FNRTCVLSEYGRRTECGACGKRLLLDTVRGDRADLRQHVLPRIEDTPACPESRLSVPTNVPCEAESRLKHLVLVGNFPVRGKRRITQIRSISSLRRRNDWVGEMLKRPAQAVIQCEVSGDFPCVLDKERDLLVVDGGEAGLVEAFPLYGRSVLQEQKQGSSGGCGASGAGS